MAVGITAGYGLPPDSCYTPFCQALPQLRLGESMEFFELPCIRMHLFSI